MTLDDFQRAKLIEWAEWCETHGVEGAMPIGIGMVNDWARSVLLWGPAHTDPFPTREQFAERQNAVTSEAI